jgi:hypothetical protein
MALISDWEFDLLVVGTAPAREKVEKKKKEKQRKSLRGITSFFFFIRTLVKPRTNKPNYKVEITRSIPLARVRVVEVE